MAIRKIVLEGDEILRKRCREVTSFDQRLWELLEDMKETLYHEQGAGLAAPQVGILKRVVVVDVGDKLYELINPEIISEKGQQTDLEGCLSIPGEQGIVTRPEKVVVKAQDRNGKEFTVKGSGLLARAFCHEIDHLNGILYKDKATQMERI